MRYYGTLALAVSVCVEGFVPAPGVSSYLGRPIAHHTRWSGRSGKLSRKVGLADAVMSLDGAKVLVSGFLNSKERTDQFVFDILQAQGKWEKIVAFSENMSFAKKRLVSRKSRYSGLLDVLEFDEGDKYDPVTMEEKLQGCSAWLCFDCEGGKVKESVEVATKAGVKTMVITSTVSASEASTVGIEDALKASGLEYTFIRVGEMIEGKEGGAVISADVTDELPEELVVRDDIIRLSAEAFVMQNTTDKAFAFGKGDNMALDYLKELRQNGTDRRTELSTLISGGLIEYREKKAAEEAEKNKPPPTPEELAEQEKEFLKSREEEYAAIRAENARQRQIDYEKKLEKEAKELLEGEWNSMYWTRDTILTLEEYQNDPENWERAMEHARAVMKKRRDDRYGTSSTEDNEEDDDEDDEEEEVEAGVENSEIEEVEVVTENDGEDDDQAGSTSEGGADVVASKEGMTSGKPKKKAGKAETEVATQDIVAESSDESGPDGADTTPPQAKLDDKNE